MAAIIHLTRQELYDRIWSKPATTLAAELGVSAANLRTVCERHNIPRPSSGHWTRVRCGEPCERPPLPPAETPELEQVTICNDRAGTSPAAEVETYPPVPVPERLTSPHPLVVTALAMLKSDRYPRYGLVCARGRGAVHIAVAPKNINRAVRIMDAFVKGLVAQGFQFEPRDSGKYADIVIRKDKESYPLKLREHLQRTELPPTPSQVEELKKWGRCFGDHYKRTPDGKLTLTVGEDYGPATCQDTVNTRLEDKLGRFVARVLRRVADDEEQDRRHAQEQAARERARAEQQRQAEEQARRQREEEDRIKSLNGQISQWRWCRDIRDFLKEVRELIALHHAKMTPGGPMAQWLDWAEGYAARIDPLAPLKAKLAKIQSMSAHRIPDDG